MRVRYRPGGLESPSGSFPNAGGTCRGPFPGLLALNRASPSGVKGRASALHSLIGLRAPPPPERVQTPLKSGTDVCACAAGSKTKAEAVNDRIRCRMALPLDCRILAVHQQSTAQAFARGSPGERGMDVNGHLVAALEHLLGIAGTSHQTGAEHLDGVVHHLSAFLLYIQEERTVRIPP